MKRVICVYGALLLAAALGSAPVTAQAEGAAVFRGFYEHVDWAGEYVGQGKYKAYNSPMHLKLRFTHYRKHGVDGYKVRGKIWGERGWASIKAFYDPYSNNLIGFAGGLRLLRVQGMYLEEPDKFVMHVQKIGRFSATPKVAPKIYGVYIIKPTMCSEAQPDCFTLYVGTESELRLKQLCDVPGSGNDCSEPFTWQLLAGPFATLVQAQQGLCQNITQCNWNSMVHWGPWVRWNSSSTWYRLFDPTAQAAMGTYCPHLPGC